MLDLEKLEKLKVIVPVILTTFGSSLVGLYLWAFWSMFDINILEYMDLADFIKLAIFPTLSLVIGCLFGLLILNLAGATNVENSKEANEYFTPLRHIRAMIVICTMAAVAIHYFFHSPIKIIFIVPMAAIPSYFLLDNLKVWRSLLPHAQHRFFILVLLAMFPWTSLAWGLIDAENIIQNYKYREVHSSIFKDPKILNGRKNLKLLGIVGDYALFVSLDNKVTFAIQYSDLKGIKYKFVRKDEKR